MKCQAPQAARIDLLRAPPAATIRDELMRVLDAKHADAVIEHPKVIGWKPGSRAAKLLAAEFAKCLDPNAAADDMILFGWRTFEAEWLNDDELKRGALK